MQIQVNDDKILKNVILIYVVKQHKLLNAKTSVITQNQHVVIKYFTFQWLIL